MFVPVLAAFEDWRRARGRRGQHGTVMTDGTHHARVFGSRRRPDRLEGARTVGETPSVDTPPRRLHVGQAIDASSNRDPVPSRVHDDALDLGPEPVVTFGVGTRTVGGQHLRRQVLKVRRLRVGQRSSAPMLQRPPSVVHQQQHATVGQRKPLSRGERPPEVSDRNGPPPLVPRLRPAVFDRPKAALRLDEGAGLVEAPSMIHVVETLLGRRIERLGIDAGPKQLGVVRLLEERHHEPRQPAARTQCVDRRRQSGERGVPVVDPNNRHGRPLGYEGRVWVEGGKVVQLRGIECDVAVPRGLRERPQLREPLHLTAVFGHQPQTAHARHQRPGPRTHDEHRVLRRGNRGVVPGPKHHARAEQTEHEQHHRSPEPAPKRRL